MRLETLDLNLIIALEAILRLRSVSAAAEELHLTQPAVSRSLAKLRQHFDDRLVVQIDRQMLPTEFGRALQESAGRLLAEMRVFAQRRPGFDPATVIRTFTVTASDYVAAVLLSKAVRSLASVAPGISLRVVSIDISTDGMFERGEVDFRIYPAMALAEDHPRAHLFGDEFVCLASADNPLVGEKLEIDTYLRLRHIVNAFGSNARDSHFERFLKASDIEIQVAASLPHFILLPDYVIGTPYLATIHRRLARLLPPDLPLRMFPVPLAIPPLQEYLQWHRVKNHDAAMIWMRDFLVSIARSELDGDFVVQ